MTHVLMPYFQSTDSFQETIEAQLLDIYGYLWVRAAGGVACCVAGLFFCVLLKMSGGAVGLGE